MPVYTDQDSAGETRVRWEWRGVVYLVRADQLRHLNPACPTLRETTGQVDEEQTRTLDTVPLRRRTARCTAQGCWSRYERDEDARAAEGDPRALIDIKVDRNQSRERLAQRSTLA